MAIGAAGGASGVISYFLVVGSKAINVRSGRGSRSRDDGRRRLGRAGRALRGRLGVWVSGIQALELVAGESFDEVTRKPAADSRLGGVTKKEAVPPAGVQLAEDLYDSALGERKRVGVGSLVCVKSAHEERADGGSRVGRIGRGRGHGAREAGGGGR